MIDIIKYCELTLAYEETKIKETNERNPHKQRQLRRRAKTIKDEINGEIAKNTMPIMKGD